MSIEQAKKSADVIECLKTQGHGDFDILCDVDCGYIWVC